MMYLTMTMRMIMMKMTRMMRSYLWRDSQDRCCSKNPPKQTMGVSGAYIGKYQRISVKTPTLEKVYYPSFSQFTRNKFSKSISI